jgi:hypothetical protein
MISAIRLALGKRNISPFLGIWDKVSTENKAYYAYMFLHSLIIVAYAIDACQALIKDIYYMFLSYILVFIDFLRTN